MDFSKLLCLFPLNYPNNQKEETDHLVIDLFTYHTHIHVHHLINVSYKQDPVANYQ